MLGHANVAHDFAYSRRPEGGDPGVGQGVCNEIFPPLGKEQVHLLFRVAYGQLDFRQPKVFAQLLKRGFRGAKQHGVNDGHAAGLFPPRPADAS